jgi:chemosensory pili system protein ChpE
MLTTALTGVLIALSFSAPPGPVAMETIRRGLGGGFRPALRVQLGSIIGDVTWCAVALLGLAPLVQIAWVRGPLAAAGVGVLLYLGALGIRDALQAAPVRAVAASPVTPGAFRSGLAISMANPMAVGYWLSVGGALVATGAAGATPAQTASFVAGFVGGTLLWAFFMAFAVRWGQRLMTPALFRVVAFVCGSILIVFGLALAYRMLGPSVS